MDYNEQTKSILVGTRGSEIIEIDGSSGKKLKTLIYGHFEGTKQAELWGLTVHPTQQLFASCGADATIRIWKLNEMVQASEVFKTDMTAIDWSSDGNFLVAGDRNGYAYLVDAQTLKVNGTVKSTLADKKNAWVEDIKISPNSKLFAFGTHGGLSKIEVAKVLENGKKCQK
jgi:WD40 repeat protein